MWKTHAFHSESRIRIKRISLKLCIAIVQLIAITKPKKRKKLVASSLISNQNIETCDKLRKYLNFLNHFVNLFRMRGSWPFCNIGAIPIVSPNLLNLNQDHPSEKVIFLAKSLWNRGCDNVSRKNARATKLWSHDYIYNIIWVTW